MIMMMVVGDVITVAGDRLCDYYGFRGLGDKGSGGGWCGGGGGMWGDLMIVGWLVRL